MGNPGLILAILLLAPPATPRAAGEPVLEWPVTGAAIYTPHPHFRWRREADVKIDEVHRVQIARDEAFADLVCEDRLEVVSRFVPVKALSPAKYWWRVRRGEGAWSTAGAFEVRAPERLFTVRAGSDAAAVAQVIQEASSNAPARVDFEPGEYRVAANVPNGRSEVTLKGTHDLILDGHGAHLVVGGTFLRVMDSQRVTIQHLTITPDRPGHTLVRVVQKDAAGGKLVVKPEPGYDADVARYFEREGNGGSFLGCMDAKHHGKYLPGAGISARDAAVAPSLDVPGAFVFSLVKSSILEKMPLDAPAVVTVYRTQWVQLDRTEECTFSDVTVSGLPGAFCGGTDNSAKSYLSCRVLRATPDDYFGGHSAVENGRIGNWIESCEFECLPDDGPCLTSLRMTVARADGNDAVVLKDDWTNRELRPGDRVVLFDAKGCHGENATVRVASSGRKAMRVQLEPSLADLAKKMDRDASAEWRGVFLYRVSPNNEDFVYRRNRHVGGRGHGVKYNGSRAWIADSHFENINGNGVIAGFTWQDGLEGEGARDVVISGNTIVRCGWTPIEALSTSRLGGNLIIRGNRIVETRDAAIAIKGCNGVTITGNDFASTTPPTKGAWIVAEDSGNVQCDQNRHPADVPEFRTATKRK